MSEITSQSKELCQILEHFSFEMQRRGCSHSDALLAGFVSIAFVKSNVSRSTEIASLTNNELGAAIDGWFETMNQPA